MKDFRATGGQIKQVNLDLRGNKELRVFDLSNNRVSYIPPWFFKPTTKLTYLSFAGNQRLKTLSNNVLKPLERLRGIYISVLSFIWLLVLKLNDCGMKEIDSKLLQNNKELEEIDLKENGLSFSKAHGKL